MHDPSTTRTERTRLLESALRDANAALARKLRPFLRKHIVPTTDCPDCSDLATVLNQVTELEDQVAESAH